MGREIGRNRGSGLTNRNSRKLRERESVAL
jgi:hypothetical protein